MKNKYLKLKLTNFIQDFANINWGSFQKKKKEPSPKFIKNSPT